MADAQRGIPQLLQERRDCFLTGGQQPLRFEQNQHIDVGIGKQVAAAISAHGQNRNAGLEAAERRGRANHDAVDALGALRERERIPVRQRVRGQLLRGRHCESG